eukprot:Hpha_TRINITY_DN16865_c0_g5::TRINITY_DN16865_c0_g5_i1::g.150935::m.150935
MYGEDAVVDIPEPEMGAEDFFEFARGGSVPAAQAWLGGANEGRGMTANNHEPDFDVDEGCLPVGAASLAAAAMDLAWHYGKRMRHRSGVKSKCLAFARQRQEGSEALPTPTGSCEHTTPH